MLKLKEFYNNRTMMALIILLVISILMSLFLPAKLSFEFFFPILILAYIIYLFAQGRAVMTIVIHIGVIIGVTVITLGVPVLFSFFAFIHTFPTYVVVLATLLILYLLPLENVTRYKKIVLFFLISTILGLNSNIIRLISDAVGGSNGIEKTIHKILKLDRHQVLIIDTNDTTVLTTYNRYDFITFGADEARMGGYWSFPSYHKDALEHILQEKGIAYTHTNKKAHPLSLTYDNNTTYGTKIEIRSNKELLSSLYIKDTFFTDSKYKNNKVLNAFEYRLEYLLRHNIWNAILFWLSKETDYKKVLLDFMEESIQTASSDVNWSKNRYEVQSRLRYSSKEKECPFHKRKSGYKEYIYPFSTWQRKHGDKSIETGKNCFLFHIKDTVYVTQVDSDEFVRHRLGCSYSKGNAKYIFRSSVKQDSTVILWKFSPYGDFLKEIHIKMPKEVRLDREAYYYISHISIKRDKIQFRLYTLREVDKSKERKKLCSYRLLEIKNPFNSSRSQK